MNSDTRGKLLPMSLKEFFKTIKRKFRVELVEMSDNKIRLAGCTFDVDFPEISQKMKASLYKQAYERPERDLYQKNSPPSLPLIELGGCIGVLSCFINKNSATPREHVVVEANPDLLPILRRNRELNQAHFDIVHAAIAYGSETIRFPVNDEILASSIHRTGQRSVQVPTQTLKSLCKNYEFDQFNLIVDIEGSEWELIKHEMDLLCSRGKWLMIELHDHILGQSQTKELQKRLEAGGFELIDKRALTYCYKNSEYTE